jgi:hypothetical protein
MPAHSITFNVEDLRTPDRLERVLRQFERAMQVTSTASETAVQTLAVQVSTVTSAGPSAPPPGLTPSVPLVSEDTHANRLTNYPSPTTIGSQFWETDRTALYIANTSLAWEYAAGAYVAAVASQPSDLGTNDTGFLFYATDQATVYIWTGAAWNTITRRILIGGFYGIFTHANTADRTYTFADETGNLVYQVAGEGQSGDARNNHDGPARQRDRRPELRGGKFDC